VIKRKLNYRFPFQKRSQFFNGVRNETLSVTRNAHLQIQTIHRLESSNAQTVLESKWAERSLNGGRQESIYVRFFPRR